MGVGTPKGTTQNNLRDDILHSPQWEDGKRSQEQMSDVPVISLDLPKPAGTPGSGRIAVVFKCLMSGWCLKLSSVTP